MNTIQRHKLTQQKAYRKNSSQKKKKAYRKIIFGKINHTANFEFVGSINVKFLSFSYWNSR